MAAGGDGDNNDGEVEHDGGDDDDNDDNNGVNIDVVEDDDDDGTTRTNGRRRCDGDGRPATRRTLASAAPTIQGNNQLVSTVWGGVDEREGQCRGGGRQKRVDVEEIEWRSLHLHSINSKPTFRPPQCRERTATYSACVLGVRLRYRHHGDHVYR